MWRFNAKRMWIEVDGTAKIYNSDFELLGMPVFYFPSSPTPFRKTNARPAC